MSASVLGHLSLGYQWIWSRLREARAVQLFVAPDPDVAVDAAHLLDLITQTWSGKSPQLIVTVQSGDLLLDLLQHARPDGPWISVADELLPDPQIVAATEHASRRGLTLLWRGAPGARPLAGLPGTFSRGFFAFTAGEALLALHEARQGAPARRKQPVPPDQIMEGLGSLTLAAYCLEQQPSWGVAGWPVEDVLHAYRDRPPAPHQPTLLRLIASVDADLSTDTIEQHLVQEPLLAYRFLRFANSASFGLRNPIESLRHGLMILGLGTFRTWLMEQLTNASNDADLQPVRVAIVARAQLMAQLLDAGDEDALRREVTLCGLLSQIDLLVGEPLGSAMQHIPVPERVLSAIVSNSGPYAPYLQIAAALEYPGMRAVPELCTRHGIDLADVNRTLLRVLAGARISQTAAGH